MPPVKVWGEAGDGADASTFPLWVRPASVGKSKALCLPGASGNYGSVPDAASLDTTGDLDLRVHLQPQEWAAAANQDLLAKWGGATNSWWLWLQTNGSLRFSFVDSGGTQRTFGGSSVVSASDGKDLRVKIELDVDNGSGGSDLEYFESTDGGATWTSLGTKTIASTSGAIQTSDSDVHVGSRDGTNSPLLGAIFSAEVRDGIDGTLALSVDPDDHTSGDTWTTDEGHTVTVNRSGDEGAACGVTDEPCWMFTGSEYQTLPDRAAFELGTGAGWMAARVTQFSTTSANNPIIGRRDGSSPNVGWQLQIRTSGVGQIAFDGGAPFDTSLGTTDITDGAPHVVVGGRDGTNTFLDTDGTNEDSDTDNAVDCTLTQDAHIGAVDGAAQGYGLVHAVALGKTALTATQRTELGTWTGSLTNPPLALYYSEFVLTARDEAAYDGYPTDVPNSLQQYLYPQMGSAAMRARKDAIGPNRGSDLWTVAD